VLFELDEANLIEFYREQLEDFLIFFKNGAVDVIQIDAHADSTGAALYNYYLSEKRGNTIKNFFVERGISEDKLRIIAHGDFDPIANNQTRAMRAKNRRVEFTILDADSPPAERLVIFHEVKASETLYSISKIYNVSIQELMKLNLLTDAGRLRIGQKLLLKKGL